MVPVTTKPFFNSVNFCNLQRVSLRHLLLIKEKISQYTHFVTNQSCFENIKDMTNKYYCTTSGIFESHYT